MEYRYLGKSGLKVSALSFGAWVTFHDQVGEDIAYGCMKEAYDAGVNFFDNAEAYAAGQAEVMMGNIIKKLGWKRSDLVLSTKLFWGGSGPNDTGLSRKHIFEGTNAALKRLQTDYVDLIFCHRPDFHTPVEETVRAMDHVINQGKALYWGTSEWPADRIMEAYQVARRENLIPPLMEQPEYNMFRRDKIEKEYIRLYDTVGLGTTIWSPLASGLLTGKYNDGVPDETRINLKGYEWLKNLFTSEEGKAKINKVRNLKGIADDLSITLPEMSLAWCLKNPNVSTVITGASKPEQVIQNMKALEVVDKLSDEVMDKIEEVLENKPQQEYDFRG
ncbi:MAG: aldo/keto reductase [Melioribacteraceae bacterium]|nr:aldo/keto reductase [Melioribacteraceae bacterium]MCF8353547.1 aldo/keto reductase [Melioribacteraceae bacterium]MCF8392519.1 aldo/keto reductase [Melioribacteraceae bacterium]MCF8418466.1 aldo/keto reductase [Melioribacteraceae bacterium]